MEQPSDQKLIELLLDTPATIYDLELLLIKKRQDQATKTCILDEQKAMHKLPIDKDKVAYPNDGARKSALELRLSADEGYQSLKKYCDGLTNLIETLQAEIEKERRLHGSNIAIAGMGKP
jgi:hypothetical protein